MRKIIGGFILICLILSFGGCGGKRRVIEIKKTDDLTVAISYDVGYTVTDETENTMTNKTLCDAIIAKEGESTAYIQVISKAKYEEGRSARISEAKDRALSDMFSIEIIKEKTNYIFEKETRKNADGTETVEYGYLILVSSEYDCAVQMYFKDTTVENAEKVFKNVSFSVK